MICAKHRSAPLCVSSPIGRNTRTKLDAIVVVPLPNVLFFNFANHIDNIARDERVAQQRQRIHNQLREFGKLVLFRQFGVRAMLHFRRRVPGVSNFFLARFA